MPIKIPDDLHKRLEQLAKAMGQDAGVLVVRRSSSACPSKERKPRPQESWAWQPCPDQDSLGVSDCLL